MKQANGSGSTYQRADGRWCTAITIGKTATGRPHVRVVYSKTRKEAQTKLRDYQDQMRHGVRMDRDRTTVAQFLTQWLADIVVHRSAGTRRRYTHEVNNHLIPALGHLTLIKLQSEDVQRMLNQRAAGGMAPQSVSGLRSTLRAALHQAEIWHLVVGNAAKDVQLPQVVDHEARILTPAQATQLLNAARGHRMEALYMLALYLGMRQGELAGLSWADVDWERARLHVRRAVQTHGGPVTIGETKTKGSKRALPLPAPLLTALRSHWVRQHEAKGAGDLGLIFPTRNGGPMDGSAIWRNFKLLLKRAGLPDMRFHDLRHSCASFLGAQGVPDRIIMEILGHTTRKMTDRYTHVGNDGKLGAVTILGELFSAARDAS